MKDDKETKPDIIIVGGIGQEIAIAKAIALRRLGDNNHKPGAGIPALLFNRITEKWKNHDRKCAVRMQMVRGKDDHTN